jgi:hypothetical protein
MSKSSATPQTPGPSNLVDLYPQITEEPRALALDVVRRAGGPHRALEQLADQLQRQADRLEDVRDPGCVFARALAHLNHRLADGLLRAGWDDPEWVALLAILCTDRYLNASQARDAGQPSRSVWASLFEAARQRQTSVREELVLGLTTHLVHDLPQALAELGLRTPTGESRLRDYHAMNDPLGLAVEDLERDLTRRYDAWFAPVDRVGEAYASILTNEGVRVARASAWYNAERLLDTQLRTGARAALRRWPLITLYELLHPPVWSARFASRQMRMLSGLARCWPGRRPGER